MLTKTIAEMARLAGKPASWVSSILSTGSTSISLLDAAKLAKCLGVSLDEFYVGQLEKRWHPGRCNRCGEILPLSPYTRMKRYLVHPPDCTTPEGREKIDNAAVDDWRAWVQLAIESGLIPRGESGKRPVGF